MKGKDLINKVAEEYAKAAFFVSQQWVATGKELFKAGIEWRDNNLWYPADGDDLPEIDREVIAILNNGKVVFAHRPPEYWDGKNIDICEVTRRYPRKFGKGGWNQPDVKIWLDCKIPFKEDEV